MIRPRAITPQDRQHIDNVLTILRCCKTEAERLEALELLYNVAHTQGGVDALFGQLREAA